MPTLKPYCNRVIFWPQYSATCWFNAVLIAALYSQYSRNMLYKISSKWDKRIEFYKMLRFVLKHKYLKTKNPEKDFKFFDIMKPENILGMIHKIKPKYINEEIANSIRGYHSEIIISKFYKLLGVSNLMFERTNDGNLYYDRRNHINITFDDYEEKVKSAEYIQNKFKKIKNPEVILINVDTNTPVKAYPYVRIGKFYKKNPHYAASLDNNTLSSLDDNVIYNGEEYVLDSVILSNWNSYQKRKDKNFKKLINSSLIAGHAIAGITCDNQRFVYNGWSRYTKDLAKEFEIDDEPDETNESDIVDSRPCELMKLDWDTKKNDEFCLNSKKCSLPFATKFLRENHMCFSFSQGNRIFVYIKKEHVTKSPEYAKHSKTPEYISYSNDNAHSHNVSPRVSPKISPKVSPKVSPNGAKNGPVNKCDNNEIRNPATNRCISEKTAVKKNLVKSITKECPEGKILNPLTGRYVKIKSAKECPEGKELNPLTGRYVKIKTNTIKKSE